MARNVTEQQMTVSRWCRCWIVAAAVLMSAAAAQAADRLTVAMLDWNVADADYTSHAESAVLHGVIEARLIGRGPVRWVERGALDKAADELRLSRFGGAHDPESWLRLGRWVKADLLVTGGVVRQDDGWVVRGRVIDTERADVLSRWATPAAGDPARAFDADAVDRAAYLRGARRGLREALRGYAASRRQTTLAPMFFENRTEVGQRLDGFEATLIERLAERCDGQPGVRTLRFPDAAVAADEHRLLLAGLAEGDPGAPRRLADVYLWGHFEEFDWQGVEFERVPVRLSVTAWNGRDAPRVFTGEGRGGALEALADEVLAEAVEWAQGQPRDAGFSAEQAEVVSAELYRRARAIQHVQAGNQYEVTPGFLRRWRETVRLLEVAFFFDPGRAELHREMIVERWREELAKNRQEIFRDPRRVRERYSALLRHVDQFGYGEDWPDQVRRANNGGAAQDNRWPATDMRRALVFVGSDAVQRSRRGWLEQTPPDVVAREHDAVSRSYVARVEELLKRYPDPQLALSATHSVMRWASADVRLAWLKTVAPMLPAEPTTQEYDGLAESVRRVYAEHGDAEAADRWLARWSRGPDAPARKPRSAASQNRYDRWVESLRIPDAIKPREVDLKEHGVHFGGLRQSPEAFGFWHDGEHGYLSLGVSPQRGVRQVDLRTRQYESTDRFDTGDAAVFAGLVRPSLDPDAIWLATDGLGAKRYDVATGSIQTYGPADGLTTTRLRVAGQTRDALVFAGGELGAVNQLCLFDPVTQRWSAYALPHPDAGEGVPADMTRLAIAGGRVVLAGDDYGTHSQMPMFDLETQTWTNLRTAWIAHLESHTRDRLPARPANPGKKLAVLSLAGDPRTGTIWIGSAYGLTRYEPAADRFTTWFSQLPREPGPDDTTDLAPRVFEDVTAIVPVDGHLLVATYSGRCASYNFADKSIGGSYLFLVDPQTGKPRSYAKLGTKAPVLSITLEGRRAWLTRRVADFRYATLFAVDWSELLPAAAGG
ncbi:MAG: hypothetical protein AAFX76_01545 [Planctomycetota bacterium]